MIYHNNSTKLLYRGQLKLLYTHTLENQQLMELLNKLQVT